MNNMGFNEHFAEIRMSPTNEDNNLISRQLAWM